MFLFSRGHLWNTKLPEHNTTLKTYIYPYQVIHILSFKNLLSSFWLSPDCGNLNSDKGIPHCVCSRLFSSFRRLARVSTGTFSVESLTYCHCSKINLLEAAKTVDTIPGKRCEQKLHVWCLLPPLGQLPICWLKGSNTEGRGGTAVLCWIWNCTGGMWASGTARCCV